MVTAPRPAARFDVMAMTGADLAAAQGLSREVHWPHRVEDWQFVLSLGSGLVAYAGDRLVGTAMWWPYTPGIARIGMVIVDPAMQRAGIGRALMRGVLDRLDAATMLLNATEAGAPLYRQIGFAEAGTIIQHQGASFSVPLVPLAAGERIRPMGRNDAARLIELDAMAGGARRDDVITALIEHGEAVVLDRRGETVGFAFYRRFGRGHVVGPVVARDPDGARALIAHWVGSNAGMFVRIDIPAGSGLSDWLDELGLVRTGAALAMVRGPAPRPSGGYGHFAIVNQALG